VTPTAALAGLAGLWGAARGVTDTARRLAGTNKRDRIGLIERQTDERKNLSSQSPHVAM
jgi:hypothetical protein